MSTRPNVFTEAKKLYDAAGRPQGQGQWANFVQQATQNLRAQFGAPKNVGKPKSQCNGKQEEVCLPPCHWVKQSKVFTTKAGKQLQRKAYCTMKRVAAPAPATQSGGDDL